MKRSKEIAEVDLRLDMPDFKTEAEEAAWWPTQESKLFEAFTKLSQMAH